MTSQSPNFENETVLIAEISHGNSDAMDFVISTYEKDIKRFAKKMFRAYGVYETGIEDDITQDVLINFYQSIKKFNPNLGTSLKTWLLAGTRNAVRNKLKAKVHISLDDKVGSVLDENNLKKIHSIILSYKQNFDGAINYEQSKFLVSEAVEKLNSPFRETMKALIDSDFEMSMHELSIMFDVSDGTTKSRLARAREALSVLLEPLKIVLTNKVGK